MTGNEARYGRRRPDQSGGGGGVPGMYDDIGFGPTSVGTRGSGAPSYETATVFADRPPTRDRSGAVLSRSTLWTDGEPPPGPQPLRARWDPIPPPATSSAPRRRRPERRRTALGWFVHRHGWRAYALPVLAALTVMTIAGVVGSSGSEGSAGAAADGGSGGVVTVTVGSRLTTITVNESSVTTVTRPADGSGEDQGPPPPVQELPLREASVGSQIPSPPAIEVSAAYRGVTMGLLPPGARLVPQGQGTFHTVPGSSDRFGTGPDLRRFTVEVEDGIQSQADDRRFAEAVETILSDERSWIGDGRISLQRVDSGEVDFRVTLTSQLTTRQDENCGWNVPLEASCYNRLPGRVFINDARWIRGAYAYGRDLASYRVYAINHEVGHALGHSHQGCPGDGGVAPVMMPQSWSTANDDLVILGVDGQDGPPGARCVTNPFVFPG